ncbi:nucleoside-diphosphate kinase [Patescibacteria group bacterium]|nr:nucleoside-diphosphate kinase [Patescibacteria group bacterium]
MAEVTERTLIICKPDALQRNLMGEIITRFERKGLKIVGLKMIQLSDVMLEEHYEHHKDKPFFDGLKRYMKQSPVLGMVLEGDECINAVRLITGATKGAEADAGTIRGDMAMATPGNLIHASDSLENAKMEIERFFKEDELFDYKKIDETFLYWRD